MADEKQKNDELIPLEEKPKNDRDRKVEWAFDFSTVGDSIRNLMDSLAGDEELQTSEFSVEKGAVESANIDVHFSVGKANLVALPADSDLLFGATVQHVGEMVFSEAGDTVKSVELSQKIEKKPSMNPIRQGFRALADRDDLEWHVQLAQGVPLNLDIDGGVGPVNLDLSDLHVKTLEADTGVGSLTLILPEQEDTITADIDGGVGQTRIYIPDNADVNLDVDAGVGAVEIILPPNAAVEIRASSGIGSINVPRSLKRLTKKEFMDNGGVWKSEGFDLADRRITIKYDAGVGAFTVREAEIV